MYQRTLSVYKGISNILEFRVKNADQKPVSLHNKIIHFAAINQQQVLILDYHSDGASITKLPATGLFSVTVREADLLGIAQQYLTYYITLEDQDGSQQLTYTNGWGAANGTLFVAGDVMALPAPVQVVETFIEHSGETGVDDSVWFSEVVSGQPAINSNEALHTAAIYTDSYQGKVLVQATLDNQIVGEQNNIWTDVAEVEINNAQEPVAVNFYGVFSYIRFVADSMPADRIVKILVRS